jgi:ABC-type phosphate/phosphonate transport system substrate-binding protein
VRLRGPILGRPRHLCYFLPANLAQAPRRRRERVAELMKKAFALILMLLVVGAASAALAADTLHFVIMSSEDPKKEGPKYAALAEYLKQGVPGVGAIELRVAKDYPEAAALFQGGEVDGMFSGSFVAGIFIKKEVARPIVRPVLNNGATTYKAYIIAKEGTKPFSGIGDFRGKKVAYTLLASSGEAFVRSLLAAGEKPESVYTPVPAASHLIAINAVQSGAADYAVVKNMVWDPAKFPGLALVGEDKGENPNNTLIMSNAAAARHGEAIKGQLLKLEADAGAQAAEVKKIFGIKAFTPTSAADFAHTFEIFEKAHIDPKSFAFSF